MQHSAEGGKGRTDRIKRCAVPRLAFRNNAQPDRKDHEQHQCDRRQPGAKRQLVQNASDEPIAVCTPRRRTRADTSVQAGRSHSTKQVRA